MARRPRLSLSVKVGLILFAVVAGALSLVYVSVVPRLESRLVDAKIEEPEDATPTSTDEFEKKALSRLGGSICFVSKKSLIWQGDNKAETDGAGKKDRPRA